MRFAPLETPSPDAALGGIEALCADLTTAANINRALAQIFLLLAQGRISRRDAVAFGYLSQLLLQTVPGIRKEFVDAFGYNAWEARLKGKLEPKAEKKTLTPNVAPPVKMPAPASALNSQPPVSSNLPQPPVPRPHSSPERLNDPTLTKFVPAVEAGPEPRPEMNCAAARAPEKPPLSPPAASAARAKPSQPARAPSEAPDHIAPALKRKEAATSLLTDAPYFNPGPAAPPPGMTAERIGHTTDWYAPASWSKHARPDPFSRRMSDVQRKMIRLNNYNSRHLRFL